MTLDSKKEANAMSVVSVRKAFPIVTNQFVSALVLIEWILHDLAQFDSNVMLIASINTRWSVKECGRVY